MALKMWSMRDERPRASGAEDWSSAITTEEHPTLAAAKHEEHDVLAIIQCLFDRAYERFSKHA